jgi:hypothetical protein
MARIDIYCRVDTVELRDALMRLSAHDLPKAIKAGVRDAAKAGRTTLAKSIGQRYSLTAGRIKQDVPTARISSDGQTAVITTSRKPITGMQFKAKPTPNGISMAIFRGQRSVIKGGFVQFSTTGAFSGKLPFITSNTRNYRGDRKRAKPRKGLDVVVGPSIHAIYTGGKWSPALQARTEVRIEDALEKGILRSLGAMGRGYGRA